MKTLCNILLEKHPPAEALVPSTAYEPDDNISEPHPVQFDIELMAHLFIRKTTLRMDGAAGPSGVDVAGWKLLCTSFSTNAFKSLNHQAALRNDLHRCPSPTMIHINSYQSNVILYIDGETILSQEGTTQGDPLAIAVDCTISLINTISNESTKQVWYADDLSAAGVFPTTPVP